MRVFTSQATVHCTDGTFGTLGLACVDWRRNETKWSLETTTTTKSAMDGARAGLATRYGAWEGELAGAFVSWEQHEHDDVLRGKLQRLKPRR